MTTTKTITIPEDEYAGLIAQASFLRAALHALGGKYEVNYETFLKHGTGTLKLEGSNDRQAFIATIVQGPHEEEPPEPPRETSEEVASSAAKILKRKSSTKAEKQVAASALAQRTGRKRITERPGVEDDD